MHTFYENDDREIINYREKKEMKPSNATIDFDDTYDAMIRTGTVIAKKIR
ncbi:MAG: hypothetical protein H6766_06265 [Candidatus Peribacteria bacterium]|nr:MAG: hypothetical protein H6766_06265 [Candidatus Peribacteria bacterium]